MIPAETFRDRSLYDLNTQEAVTFNDENRPGQILITGLVTCRPFRQKIKDRKSMAVFNVHGQIVDGDSQVTDFDVRVFGAGRSRWMLKNVRQGASVTLAGHLGKFLEKDSKGNLVVGDYFFFSNNTYADVKNIP